MNLNTIIKELNLQVLTGADKLDAQVKGAYASDLLSDVMGKARERNLWITMQTHKNIVAVASLKEVAAIIIVNNGKPEEDTLAAAEKEGVVLLSTGDTSYMICGKLYKLMERDAMV
jgi:serine kinase of HPr protein (carbohydrate metabolism regulator)